MASAADFKNITVKPMTGVFDSLSTPDAVGFGNFRVVKNATTRDTRSRQRAGGWRRLFADDEPYGNADLHDQLVDQLSYYGQYAAHAMGGGGFDRYGFPYQFPNYVIPQHDLLGPVTGPYCPVYAGDFPSLMYNGCEIYQYSVGYPFNMIPAGVDPTGAREHWKMDSVNGTTPGLFGGLDLTAFGSVAVTGGVLGSALHLGASIGDFLRSTNAAFQTGDIKFGFTGWVKLTAANFFDDHRVLGRWKDSADLEYGILIQGDRLWFQVSNNGSTVVEVQNGFDIALNEWVFFAAWHDPAANTINIKTDGNPTQSLSHATGVFIGTAQFRVGGSQDIPELAPDFSIDSLTFWKDRFPSESELSALYLSGFGLDYPFDAGGACDTGYPNYYLYSFLYTQCREHIGDEVVPGYPYGPSFPVYSGQFSYDYIYCGDYLFFRPGCREAITTLGELVLSTGRKLFAATMSRVYEYNQSSGSWRVIADGLGNSGYTALQCGCNGVRGMFASMGVYLIFTNNFDPVLIYAVGDAAAECTQQALLPVADLLVLGIGRAGGVIEFKGFLFIYDITENGERFGGDVMWSDLEDPFAFIESDVSLAGRATIAIGATILNAAKLGNWLIFYTDKGIIRCSLVGGDEVFNFEQIYTSSQSSGDALKYKFSLINCGDLHLYLGESDAWIFTQFDFRPIMVPWITKAVGMIFNGIAEDDATYSPLNEEACNLVTGGYNERTKEAHLSWPSGDSTCPDVTLRFNMKFQAADFIDHGFTAFHTFRKELRPTVGEWLEDLGVCDRGTQVATGPRDGPICPGTEDEVVNPPLYLRNPTEDSTLPIHPDSLCADLQGKTLDDYCRDCAAPATFIMASATDFCLKQFEDSIYYRERLAFLPAPCTYTQFSYP